MAVVLNPKVGTTTFRQVLLDALQAVRAEPQLGRLWPIEYRRRHLFSPPSHYLDLCLHPERYRFHCFVRNPYARLVSAWRDKFTLDEHGRPTARSMRRELPAVRKFAGSRGLSGATHGSAMPFETFVAYVESQVEGSRNHHWDTQRSVLATDLIDYDDVYRIETEFEHGISRIFSSFGLPQEWLADRLTRPLNTTAALGERVYTEELADRVHRVYRGDFEEFGYDESSWQEL